MRGASHLNTPSHYRLSSPRALLESVDDNEYLMRTKELGDEEQSSRMRSLRKKRLQEYCGFLRITCAIVVGSSVFAIQTANHAVVIIASLMSIGFAFLLLMQQRDLKRFGSLRKQNNELRKTANTLTLERERLLRTLDRMDLISSDLHHIPQALHKISRNKNVDRFLEVLEEREQLQEKMRENISQAVVQEIMRVVVRSDRDGDWTLKPTEIETLIVRLGFVDGIEVDQRRLRRMLMNEPSLSCVIKVIRSLLERDDEYEHPPTIIAIK